MKSLFYFHRRHFAIGFAFLVLFGCTSVRILRAQSVIFERVTSNISDDTLELSKRQTHRIERFISRVYPVRSMRRAVHRYDRPLLKKARYDVVELDGRKYIIVAYVAEWDQFVHELALYRMTNDGPVQVWRSDAWRANYYGLSFESVPASKRMLLLFKEGGLDPSGFSLSGLVTFRESQNGIVLRDLTPRLPHLRATTNFPSHALYGKKVVLEESPEGEIILAASDDEFGAGKDQDSPTNFWRYNQHRGRFEAYKAPNAENSVTTSLTQPAK